MVSRSSVIVSLSGGGGPVFVANPNGTYTRKTGEWVCEINGFNITQEDSRSSRIFRKFKKSGRDKLQLKFRRQNYPRDQPPIARVKRITDYIKGTDDVFSMYNTYREDHVGTTVHYRWTFGYP